MSTYRVGNHQPQNVYRGEQYIGVMFTAEDAALAVEALNGTNAALDRQALAPTPSTVTLVADPGPFAPIVDRCTGCGCAKTGHRPRGCTGDFGCCPCETWMPLEAQP